MTLNGFNKLPGFGRSAPGLEQRIWVRLPGICLWGTLLPLGLGCFIVKVTKGPADVADVYPLPSEITEPTTRP